MSVALGITLLGWGSLVSPAQGAQLPWVQSAVGSEISESWRTFSPSSEEEGHRSVKLGLGIGAESYPYTSTVFGEKAWADYTVSFHGGVYDGPFLVHADGVAGMTSQRGNPIWAEFKELYVGTTPLAQQQSQIHLGRQWVQWSRLDEEFALGITQPRFKWNPLRPYSVGLLGGFWNVDIGHFHTLLFGSLLSVPERGYPLNVEDGVVSSPSPFFTAPQASTPFLNGVETPIYYSLALPELSELLLGLSAGGRVEVGDSRSGPWMSSMYLYKPINQVVMNFDYRLNVATNPNRIDMTLHPTRWMHHVGGFEAGYATQYLAGWAGATGEIPVNTGQTDAAWATQQFTRAATAGGGLELRAPTGFISGSRLGVSYLHTWGGNAPDRNPPAPVPGGSQFDFRYPWRDALQLKVRLRAPRIESEGKLTWDLTRNSLLGQVDLSLRPLRNWEILLGGTWVQTQNTSLPVSPENPDVLGPMADLDSITAGVRYTF